MIDIILKQYILFYAINIVKLLLIFKLLLQKTCKHFLF